MAFWFLPIPVRSALSGREMTTGCSFNSSASSFDFSMLPLPAYHHRYSMLHRGYRSEPLVYDIRQLGVQNPQFIHESSSAGNRPTAVATADAPRE
jgi:hypothetical protein